MTLFAFTVAFGSTKSGTEYVVANDEDAAIVLLESRGYDYNRDCLRWEVVPAPRKIPFLDFNAFVGKFHGKGFPNQRFGQAFLNEFSSKFPIVDAYRWGGYLWEEKNTNICIDKITELGLLDWS